MSERFEDVSRWPIGRYFREVVATKPDGRVLLFSAKVNWGVGLLVACSLMFMPISQHFAWVHVILFLAMPVVGFFWFVRDMPSPHLTASEPILRKPWQRRIDTLFQLIPALLPWLVLAQSHERW
jgi:hypothetical protein